MQRRTGNMAVLPPRREILSAAFADGPQIRHMGASPGTLSVCPQPYDSFFFLLIVPPAPDAVA
jgi:hypothetical protein